MAHGVYSEWMGTHISVNEAWSQGFSFHSKFLSKHISIMSPRPIKCVPNFHPLMIQQNGARASLQIQICRHILQQCLSCILQSCYFFSKSKPQNTKRWSDAKFSSFHDGRMEWGMRVHKLNVSLHMLRLSTLHHLHLSTSNMFSLSKKLNASYQNPISFLRFSSFNIQQRVEVSILLIGDLTLTRDEDNSLYISGWKPHLMSRFYEVELGLKSTS